MNTGELWQFAEKHPLVTVIFIIAGVGWAGSICVAATAKCQ